MKNRKNVCKRKSIWENYVKIYEIDLYFYNNHKEKLKVDKKGHEYIPFGIDVYFSEYNLAAEVDENGHTDRDLIFEKKRQEALEKILYCKFIRANPNKGNYDVFFEIARTQTFTSEFKNKKLKELGEEITKIKEQISSCKQSYKRWCEEREIRSTQNTWLVV